MRKVIALLSLVGGMLFIPAASYAVGSSGFELATNSARSLGKGNAVVADPDEPAVIAFNAAGITKLDGTQVTSSMTLILPDIDYEGADEGVSESASLTVSPVPATFISVSTPIKGFKVGGGVNAPFGLQTKYDSAGTFKYSTYFNELKSIGYSVVAAQEIAPWISVGGGWTYLESSLKQVGKLNSNLITASVIPGFPIPLEDAPFELEVDGHGQGWNMGVLITPNDQHSLGFSYRSAIRVAYRGLISVDDIQGPVMGAIFGGPTSTTSADTDITFPDNYTIGYRYSPNDQWDIEVDLGWTRWSEFDQVDVLFGAPNVVLAGLEPVKEDFNDTISVHVGLSCKINPVWTVTTGYLYYEMAATEETYSNAIPDGDRHAVALGLQYNQKNYSIDLTYFVEFVGPTDVDNNVGISNGASVDGEYSSFTQLLSLSATFRF